MHSILTFQVAADAEQCVAEHNRAIAQCDGPGEPWGCDPDFPCHECTIDRIATLQDQAYESHRESEWFRNGGGK